MKSPAIVERLSSEAPSEHSVLASHLAVPVSNIMHINSFTVLSSNNVNTTIRLIERFHLSGHTFRFCWIVQDLEVFLV